MPTQTVPGVLVVRPPTAPALPIVFDSPHSGFEFPSDFRPVAGERALITSCDRFVDELWGAAPEAGATLLAALFPRAYIDPNRADSDIDPALLAEPWPGKVEGSDYTRRGMGLIRRYALPGIPLYDHPLSVAEVENRLARYYHPYRQRLAREIEAAVARDGAVWHCNCHSMKPRGNAMNVDAGRDRPAFVLSDRHGRTSDGRFTLWFAERLAGLGYSVSINDPYEGGDLVGHFGRPEAGRNSLQIEINRALYLNPDTFERSEGFEPLVRNLSHVLKDLAAYVRSELARRGT